MLPTRCGAQSVSTQAIEPRLPDRPSYPHLFAHRNSYNFFSTNCRIVLLSAIAARYKQIPGTIRDDEPVEPKTMIGLC
jgi:hypothetical protein